jgi:hypothetical protein
MFLLGATLVLGACNSKPTTSETPAVDSAHMAARESHTTAAAKPKVIKQKAADNDAAEPGTETSNAGTMSSESDNTAKAKKGWSKTAKGAVIGGVVGAGTGAVVNKKNRAVGAVVGGAVGAGAGAIIGNEMDKKDGRH